MPTLREQYAKMTEKKTFAARVPFIIRLFENPASPLPFPGQIDLKDHDYLHCIFGQPMSLKGEAFVLGFTMGCDDRLTPLHLFLFKLLTPLLYPKQYAFKAEHWKIFDEALKLGKRSPIRNLHRHSFTPYIDREVADLRPLFMPA